MTFREVHLSDSVHGDRTLSQDQAMTTLRAMTKTESVGRQWGANIFGVVASAFGAYALDLSSWQFAGVMSFIFAAAAFIQADRLRV